MAYSSLPIEKFSPASGLDEERMHSNLVMLRELIRRNKGKDYIRMIRLVTKCIKMVE